MKNKVIWALGALNVLLALGLFTRLTAPAQAQAGRPSEYILVPGQVVGGTNDVVWVIDSRNQQLSGMTIDNNRNVVMMQPLDLKRVFGP